MSPIFIMIPDSGLTINLTKSSGVGSWQLPDLTTTTLLCYRTKLQIPRPFFSGVDTECKKVKTKYMTYNVSHHELLKTFEGAQLKTSTSHLLC